MNFRIALKADAASVNFAHQLRQLSNIGRNAPRLVTRQQLGRRPSSRLILKVDVGELPLGTILDDEARPKLFSSYETGSAHVPFAAY
jgi:hypothetical protein